MGYKPRVSGGGSGSSGVYTPIANDISGIFTALAPSDAQWMQVGNVVTVSGYIQINPFATILAPTGGQFTMTLPVTDAVFSNVTQVGGFVIGDDPGNLSAFVTGFALALVSDVIIVFTVQLLPVVAGARLDCAFHFTYQVIPS